MTGSSRVNAHHSRGRLDATTICVSTQQCDGLVTRWNDQAVSRLYGPETRFNLPERHPVTFTIDYETSVSGYLGGSKRGLEAVVWGKYETLSDSDYLAVCQIRPKWSWELGVMRLLADRIRQLKAI